MSPYITEKANTENTNAKPAGTFRHQRNMTCAPSEVYAAFADPQRLATWWGPNGFSNTFEIFEFKIDGRWKFVMHGSDGANYPNDSVFRELDAGNKIVIEHISPPLFTLTVSLLPSDGGTTVVWEQAFADPAVAAQVRHICEPGNEQNLDRLQKLLTGTPS